MADPKKIDPSLPGILVLSHGKMCCSLLESAEMIVGKMDNNVFAFPYMPGDDFTSYAKEITDFYTALPKGSIILFDMFGGTPFNQVIMLCAQTGLEVHGLCGVNLPILIEAVTLRDTCCGEELIEQLKAAGEISLVNVKQYIATLLNSN